MELDRDVQLVRDRLGDASKSDIRRVANEAGVSLMTLWYIAKGKTKNPRINTIRPVADVLRREAA